MKRTILTAIIVVGIGTALLATPGFLDTSFNGTGLATTDFAIAGIGNFHQAKAVAVDHQNRPVAAGITTAGSSITPYDVAIARYNADGTPDTSFNGTGKVIYDVGGDDRGAAVAIDSQDRILVAGSSDWKAGCNTASCGGNYNFFVARFNVDGSLDTSYGDGGRLIVGAGSDNEFVGGMAIDAAGRAVIAGWTGGDAKIALIRVLPDGSRDTTFDGDGLVVSQYVNYPFWSAPTGLTIAPDGAYLISLDMAGFTTVARYGTDGQPASFYHPPTIGGGTDKECYYATFTSTAVDASGRIVATGYCSGENFEGPGAAILMMRLMPDGSFDPTFAGGGIFKTHFGVPDVGKMEAYGVAIDGLGNITISGLAQSDGCGLDMLIARFNAAGVPDVRFGRAGDGSSLIDFGSCADDTAHAMAVDRRGDFVLAGATASSTTVSNFAVARVLTLHPDYSFIDPVAPINVAPGETGSTTLTINSIDGFHDTLKIGPAAPLPDGFSFAFDGAAGEKTIEIPAWDSAATVFSVTVAATVLPGTYQLSIYDSRLTDPAHTAIVTVNVGATPMALAGTVAEFVASGEIDTAGIGTSLTRQIEAGAYAAAKQHVAAQTGKHITTGAATILNANLDDLIRQGAR